MRRRISENVVNDYGLRDMPWDYPTQLDYDRMAFALNAPLEATGLTRFELFRRIADQIIPGYFEWHDWTNRLIETLCNNRWIGVAGAAGSSKTYNVAGFCAIYWLCYPENSLVQFCSTTMKMLRKRGWRNIQTVYQAVRGNAQFEGNFVDSRTVWQRERGDDKHAIFGFAVQEGGVVKAAADIQGLHASRQVIVIDEAEGIPPAIWEAAVNLYSYPDDFKMVAIANPRSWLSEFGRFCEPSAGVPSVSIEDDEWDTTRKLDGTNGICIRFDAEKSPNILEGKLVARHLPRKEKVESARAMLGGAHAPAYWSHFRGFWPPEGLLKTVFSESALQTFGAFDRHLFSGRHFRVIGFLDPAFGGGDRPALRFGKLGEAVSREKPSELVPDAPKRGTLLIEAMPAVILTLDARSRMPIHYQLAEQVQAHCAKMGCLPDAFGLDSTGEGGGLADILSREWSPRIQRVEFGAAASEAAVSFEDGRISREVYANKSAEMWFRARLAVDSGQLKGIDHETARELVSRKFDDSKRRIVLQPKAEFKVEYGFSCDLADSLVGLCEVARRFGFTLSKLGTTAQRGGDFEKELSASQELVTSDSAPEELEFEPIDTFV